MARCGRGGEASTRGSDVIYRGPARLVLAAASQLRDATLMERYAEEWLANLQGRTHLQQWRDAASLLVRGARTTRWIYDDSYAFRPRVAIVGQAMMALAMIVGTGFLFFFTSQLEIPMKSFHIALYGDSGTISFAASNNVCFCWRSTSFVGYNYILTEPAMLALFLSLATASTFGLALLVARSRWVISAGITVCALATCGTIHLLAYHEYSFFNTLTCWWAAAGALAVFLHSNVYPMIRVLAAVEFVAILRVSPLSWLPHEISRPLLGLTNFLQLLLDRLSSTNLGSIITLRVVLGAAFLLCGIFAWMAPRCAVVILSLIRPARCDSGGTWT